MSELQKTYVLVFEHDEKSGVYWSSLAPGNETTDLNLAYRVSATTPSVQQQNPVFCNVVEIKRAISENPVSVSRWVVSSVKQTTSGEEVTFSPIQDSVDDEDKLFTKYTPSGNQVFFVNNPSLIGKYTPGMIVEQTHLEIKWERV